MAETSIRSWAFSHDKGSVVIEIGRIYTRIGMSGEPAPRHIIRSKVKMNPYEVIYEGIPVISAWQSTSCAAKTVHNTVLQSVLERGTVKSSNALEDKPLYLKSGIETALEDIIVARCLGLQIPSQE
jgi:actin-related protein